MSQTQEITSYNFSNPNAFSGPGIDMSSDQSPLDTIREQTSKIEDFLDTLRRLVKPYVLPWRSLLSIEGSTFNRGGPH